MTNFSFISKLINILSLRSFTYTLLIIIIEIFLSFNSLFRINTLLSIAFSLYLIYKVINFFLDKILFIILITIYL